MITVPSSCHGIQQCNCLIHRSLVSVKSMISREKRKTYPNDTRLQELMDKKKSMSEAIAEHKSNLRYRNSTNNSGTITNVASTITIQTQNINESPPPPPPSEPYVIPTRLATEDDTVEDKLIREFSKNLERSGNDMLNKDDRQRCFGSDCGNIYLYNFSRLEKNNNKRKRSADERDMSAPPTVAVSPNAILQILAAFDNHLILYPIINHTWAEIFADVSARQFLNVITLGVIMITKELYRIRHFYHLTGSTVPGRVTIADQNDPKLKITYQEFDYDQKVAYVNINYDGFERIAKLKEVDGAMLSALTCIEGIHETMKSEMEEAHHELLTKFKRHPRLYNKEERRQSMYDALHHDFDILQ